MELNPQHPVTEELHSRVSWPYVAAFFDGEGTLVHYGALSWYAGLYQKRRSLSHRCPLEEIHIFLKMRGIKASLMVHDRKSSVWALNIARREDLVSFLRGVLPFLIVKKQHAEDLLRFFTLFPKLNLGKSTLLKESAQRRERQRKEELCRRACIMLMRQMGLRKVLITPEEVQEIFSEPNCDVIPYVRYDALHITLATEQEARDALRRSKQ